MRWIPRPMRYGLKQSLPWPSLHTLPSCPSLAKSSGVPRFLHLTSRSLESLADDVTERCWPLGLWGSDKVFTKRAFFSCCCQETILCWLKPFDCIVYIQWYFLVLLCEHGRRISESERKNSRKNAGTCLRLLYKRTWQLEYFSGNFAVQTIRNGDFYKFFSLLLNNIISFS